MSGPTQSPGARAEPPPLGETARHLSARTRHRAGGARALIKLPPAVVVFELCGRVLVSGRAEPLNCVCCPAAWILGVSRGQ
eukprot:scaffold19796_cov80-Phaeocystis_antarctica.AAC.2